MWSMYHLIGYLLVMFHLLRASTGVDNSSRHQVKTMLLDANKYDGTISPDFNKDYPTEVIVHIYLHGMHSVSEASMEVSVDLYLRMWWADERLNYTSLASYDRLELDVKTMDSVWQPDIFFENEKRGDIHSVTTSNKLMHIYRNGTVAFSIRLGLTLACPMKLQYYPFDVQKCPIYIQSFGYTRSNINLNWMQSNAFQVRVLEMPQFDLDTQNIDLTDYETTYSVGTFSTLKATLTIQRKVGYYFVQVFIPSMLLVVLSWVSFWVDASAVSARVSLGVTCVLTLTTQSSSTRLTLPPVSYVKAIDIWMFTSLLFVFSALLEYAYVNTLLRQGRAPTDVIPDDDKDKHKYSCIQILRTCRVELDQDDAKFRAKRADVIARFVFPAMFALFLIIFFSSCMSSSASSL